MSTKCLIAQFDNYDAGMYISVDYDGGIANAGQGLINRYNSKEKAYSLISEGNRRYVSYPPNDYYAEPDKSPTLCTKEQFLQVWLGKKMYNVFVFEHDRWWMYHGSKADISRHVLEYLVYGEMRL